MLKKINEIIAKKATELFGSMPTFWLFFIWSLLPIIPLFAHFKESILYVSSGIIQLVALPLILVGQGILGKKSEFRSEQDHILINEQFKIVNELLIEIKDLHRDTHKLLQDKKNVV